jgi:hypothetical protein
MSNPSKGYIRRVARTFNDDGTGMRGNLKAVITAVLTDRVALRTQRYTRIRGPVNINGRSRIRLVGMRVTTRGTEYSRLQEPVLAMTQFFKLYGQPAGKVVSGNNEVAVTGYRIYPSSLDTNQLPYKAPSVFSFYRPDFRFPGSETYTPSRWIPNGELHGPEFQIFTPVVANRFPNMMYRHLHTPWNTYYRSVDCSQRLGFEAKLASQEDLLPLMERLNILLCHGSMSDRSEEIIAKSIAASGSTDAYERARIAVLAVLTSPEFAIRE